MKNKKIFTAVILLIGALIIAYQFSFKAEAKSADGPGETTITGEVIDLSCYLANGQDGRGTEHKECAVMCSKAGSSLCILTSKGEVYFPVSAMGKNNNEKLLDFVADNVEVTGTVVTQSGINGIKITSIKKVQ